MNEKDYSKTINLKKLNNNHCSYFKLMKSEYMKNSYLCYLNSNIA